MGFASAFAGLARAAALALRADSPRFPATSNLPRKNGDRNGRVLHNASATTAPEALP